MTPNDEAVIDVLGELGSRVSHAREVVRLRARVTELEALLREMREAAAEAIEWCEHEFVIVEDLNARRQQLQRIDAVLAGKEGKR